MMGPVILIALGILFLVTNFGDISSDVIVPILLIVAGLLLVVVHNASAEGHIQPRWAGGGPLDQESEQKDPYQTPKEPQVKL